MLCSIDFIWQSLQQLHIEIVILTTNIFRRTVANYTKLSENGKKTKSGLCYRFGGLLSNGRCQSTEKSGNDKRSHTFSTKNNRQSVLLGIYNQDNEFQVSNVRGTRKIACPWNFARARVFCQLFYLWLKLQRTLSLPMWFTRRHNHNRWCAHDEQHV